jgi:hypothetical protein
MVILGVESLSKRHLIATIDREHLYRWGAIAILCFGVYLRLLGLQKGVWLDEAYTLERITGQDFLLQLRLSDHPPLYYVLLKLWSQVNSSQTFLRLLSVFFGAGVIVVVMKWLKPYSSSGSLLAGLYCATLPLMLRYSQELKGYPLLLLATALSFYFASRLVSEPERLGGYLGLGLSLATAVATHAVGVMLLPSLVVYGLLAASSWRKIHLKRAVLAFMLPGCLFVLLFFFFLQDGPGEKDPNVWWISTPLGNYLLITARGLLGGDQFRWPWWVVANTMPTLSDGIVTFLRREWDIVILFILFLGLLPLGNWRRSLPCLAGVIAFWGQMFIYSVFVLPVLIDRTALPGMVPFAGFLGIAIGTIRWRRLKLAFFAGLILMCLLFTASWIGKDAGKPVEAWGEISQLLESTSHSADMILLYPDHVEFPLKYYTDLPSETVLPIPYNSDMIQVEQAIKARFSQLGEGDSPNLFLIVHLQEDERNRLENYQQLLTYLESEFGKPTLLQQFGQLSLAKYEFHREKP